MVMEEMSVVAAAVTDEELATNLWAFGLGFAIVIAFC